MVQISLLYDPEATYDHGLKPMGTNYEFGRVGTGSTGEGRL